MRSFPRSDEISHSQDFGEDIHKIPLEALFKSLQSSRSGLSSQEAQERIITHGPNKLTEKRERSLIIKFLSQFHNFFSYLLLFGAMLSFVSEWLQPGEGSIFIALALLGVTILNATFTFIQEHKAEKAMRSFKNLMTARVVVLRDGARHQIDSTELVPGDIMLLSEGDKITADARLFKITGLKVNHSALTGESEPLLRSIDATSDKILLSRNMVLSGTLVQSGLGKALVVNTGDHTQIGKIAKTTHDIVVPASHIQKELQYFIKIISYIAIFLGVTFFLLGMFVVKNPFWTNIVFAIGIIVANVPEGLLPTVTLTLSIAAQRMARQNVLVKNIDSIETLGSVTTICCDKTGTLTENILFVHGLHMNGQLYRYNRAKGHLTLNGRTVKSNSIQGHDRMNEIMILCNNSLYVQNTRESFGDSTEICLKKYAASFMEITRIEKAHPRTLEIPFTSETKYMITSHRFGDNDRALLKGAPEIVIEKCTHILIDGSPIPITDNHRNAIHAENDRYAEQGFRILGAGFKQVPPSSGEMVLEKPAYCFVGLIIMQDPPRKEVPEAVRLCHKAGIKIFVISGDHEKTVESIARQVGILSSQKPFKVRGDELQTYDDDALLDIVRKNEVIFARVLPKDKLRIVSALKDIGQIVAVTGDGVNDAPALRKADVGIAMGKSGTEVAKEAADIILLDDNFSSIVHAIKSGRTVYDNIKSFILYILTSNTPEIVPFLFFVLFAWPLALPVLLILCIDLGTDMLPAIGLGMESASPDIMDLKPRDPKRKIVNWKMIARSYGFIGPLQTTFAYFVFFYILFGGGWTWGNDIAITSGLYMSAVTGFFGTVVITQAFNVFACRTSRASVFSKGVLSNWFILVGITSEILLLLMFSYVPIFETILGTRSFPAQYFLWMIGFGAVILGCEELRKLIFRRFEWFGLD